MAQEDDKGLFDRLGEILNAPLPGTRLPECQSEARDDGEDDSLLEHIRDIHNTPLPGARGAESDAQGSGQTPSGTGNAAPPQGATGPSPELDESWWKHWRLTSWKQAVANSPGGQKPPPPPWNMPPGGQMHHPGGGMPGPMNGPPPWMRPPGPGRRRS